MIPPSEIMVMCRRSSPGCSFCCPPVFPHSAPASAIHSPSPHRPRRAQLTRYARSFTTLGPRISRDDELSSFCEQTGLPEDLARVGVGEVVGLCDRLGDEVP